MIHIAGEFHIRNIESAVLAKLLSFTHTCTHTCTRQEKRQRKVFCLYNKRKGKKKIWGVGNAVLLVTPPSAPYHTDRMVFSGRRVCTQSRESSSANRSRLWTKTLDTPWLMAADILSRIPAPSPMPGANSLIPAPSPRLPDTNRVAPVTEDDRL